MNDFGYLCFKLGGFFQHYTDFELKRRTVDGSAISASNNPSPAQARVIANSLKLFSSINEVTIFTNEFLPDDRKVNISIR